MIKSLLTLTAATALCLLLVGCNDSSNIGSDGKPAAPRPAPQAPQAPPDVGPGAVQENPSGGGAAGGGRGG